MLVSTAIGVISGSFWFHVNHILKIIPDGDVNVYFMSRLCHVAPFIFPYTFKIVFHPTILIILFFM